MTRPRVPVPMSVLRGGGVDVDTFRAPLFGCTVTRAAAVLSSFRGRIFLLRFISGRSVPLGPRVGGVDCDFSLVLETTLMLKIAVFNTVVSVATLVVDLTGTLLRVRTGAVCLNLVIAGAVPVVRLCGEHLPPSQIGVVLAGAVRTGSVLVSIAFWTRDLVATPAFRTGRVSAALFDPVVTVLKMLVIVVVVIAGDIKSVGVACLLGGCAVVRGGALVVVGGVRSPFLF